MVSNPRPGQRVQLWYAAKARAAFPLHARPGRVEVVGKARPRNHGVRLDGGPLVVVPAGNLRPAGEAGR